MEIPTGCSSGVSQIVFEGNEIKIYSNNSQEVKYDFTSNDIYNNINNPQGSVLTNDSDNNIPGYETSFNQNVNGKRYKIWYSNNATYGGCGSGCVGCTTCNGCYSAKNTSSTCTSGCTTSCASGCTSGCTESCTGGCTNNYEGRKGKDNQGNLIIVCKGCNSECNNCTMCTACVNDVERMYCVLATTCQGCTDGVTAQVYAYGLSKYFDCKKHCQNGLNGLYDGIVNEQEGIIFDLSKCVSVVSDFSGCDNMNLHCLLFTTKYSCTGNQFSCLNLNNNACTSCDSCTGCASCTGSCASCTGCDGSCAGSTGCTSYRN